MKDKLFYVGQKAIINNDGKILILRDSVLKTHDLPGGKIQEKENDFTSALKREVYEETGLIIEVGELSSAGYFMVPINSGHRSAGKEIFLIFYEAKYLKGKVKLSDEHDQYEWVDKKKFKTLFKNKNNIYSALEKYFTGSK